MFGGILVFVEPNLWDCGFFELSFLITQNNSCYSHQISSSPCQCSAMIPFSSFACRKLLEVKRNVYHSVVTVSVFFFFKYWPHFFLILLICFSCLIKISTGQHRWLQFICHIHVFSWVLSVTLFCYVLSVLVCFARFFVSTFDVSALSVCVPLTVCFLLLYSYSSYSSEIRFKYRAQDREFWRRVVPARCISYVSFNQT